MNFKGTNIEWTDFTWNPFIGCSKVAPECKNCYMFRDLRRFGKDPETVTRTSDKTFFAPDRLSRPLPGSGTRRPLVFTCSWSDFFHPDADGFRSDAWAVIRRNPGIIFQILTKRPGRIAKNLPADWGEGYENVWLGVSAGSQQIADAFIPILRRVPANVRFVSAEPLLGELDLQRHFSPCAPSQKVGGDWYKTRKLGDIHWVIVGGESGVEKSETGEFVARACHFSWVQKIVHDCQRFDVPVFVKQLGQKFYTAPGFRVKPDKSDPALKNIENYPTLNVRQYPVSWNQPF